MTPDQAIEAAEAIEAETASALWLARFAYQAGRRDAEQEMAQRWNQIARAAVSGPAHAELEERRWGPDGRAHFADPRPGDFPGRAAPQPGPHPEPEPEAEADT